MFRKSRRKIILSIMTSLLLLFVSTLLVILLVNFREVRKRNREMLEHHVEMYALERVGKLPEAEDFSREMPPKRDIPMDRRPDYRLSTFYTVAISEDNAVLSVEDGDRELYSREELIELAEEVLSRRQTIGSIQKLSYMVSQREGYTLIAFMDTTVSESGLNTLLRTVLIVGGIAIVFLFFISLLLSGWIIRPLEENDRQQKRFISDAGHELKTPIAVISANTELLSRELGENEWLSNVQYENERMGELVKQLLELSRAESAEPVMESLDFSRLVTGETLAMESLAFEKGKRIRSEIEEEFYLSGNTTELRKLVSILLDNAVRYSTGTEIEVSLKRREHTMLLSVENEAVEIPEEKLEHLFDRFYRLDEARENTEGHYGLGLSIARAVAKQHGGNISVDCQGGKIYFTVHIPEKRGK